MKLEDKGIPVQLFELPGPECTNRIGLLKTIGARPLTLLKLECQLGKGIRPRRVKIKTFH